MAARRARAATVALAGLSLPLLTAGPAWAERIDDGEHPSTTGWLFALLVYAGIPLGLFLLMAALTYGPSALRKPRYRPTLAWDRDAVWFNGPPDPDSALARTSATSTANVKGGGASASW